MSCHIWNNGQLRKCLYELHNISYLMYAVKYFPKYLSSLKFWSSIWRNRLFNILTLLDHHKIFYCIYVCCTIVLFLSRFTISYLFKRSMFWHYHLKTTFAAKRLWPPNKWSIFFFEHYKYKCWMYAEMNKVSPSFKIYIYMRIFLLSFRQKFHFYLYCIRPWVVAM